MASKGTCSKNLTDLQTLNYPSLMGIAFTFLCAITFVLYQQYDDVFVFCTESHVNNDVRVTRGIGRHHDVANFILLLLFRLLQNHQNIYIFTIYLYKGSLSEYGVGKIATTPVELNLKTINLITAKCIIQ